MRMPFAVGSVLTLVLAAGCTHAADEAKSGSGPQVGETVVPFEPLNVTGPYAGKKECQV
jgi:hypothetical protein